MNASSRKTIVTALATACAVSSALVFPYVEVYCRNRDFTALTLPAALGFAAAGFLLTAAPLMLLLLAAARFRKLAAANALIFGFGLTVLLNYLAWSRYFPARVEDGFFSSDYLLLAGVHLFLLLAVPVLAFLWRQRLLNWNSQIALIVILTEIAATAAVAVSSRDPGYDFVEYSLAEDGKFTFAREENVIVIVVDAMGEALVKEVMAQYPELYGTLRDFVCFDRMESPIPCTAYAVPMLLTGVEYPHPVVPHAAKAAESAVRAASSAASGEEGSEKDGEDEASALHAAYLASACRTEHSIFQGLRRHGFRIEGYPFILQTISYSPEVIDNAVPVDYQARKRSAVTIFDAALDRQVPFFLKPLLKNISCFAADHFVKPQTPDAGGSERDPFDLVFKRRMENEFRVGLHEKGFKYLHLHGAHDPVRTDEFVNIRPNIMKRDQLRGALRIVGTLLDHLRAEGLYDKATIVITGDHTEFYTPETVTFVKRKFQHQERLSFNSVPCRLTAIAGTVLQSAVPEEGTTGLFDLPPVQSDGSARKIAGIGNLIFPPWRETEPRRVEDFKLYRNSFEWRAGRLRVTGDERHLAEVRAVTLLMRHLDSGRCWESTGQSGGRNWSFLEGMPFPGPDGTYQVFVSGKAGEWLSLPQFAVLCRGAAVWTNEIPGAERRPLKLGETVDFRPMKHCPSVRFPKDECWRNGAFQLASASLLTVLLPERKTKTVLTLFCRRFPAVSGTVLVRDGGAEIAEVAIRSGKLEIPIVFAPGPERECHLSLEIAIRAGFSGTTIRSLPFLLTGLRFDAAQ